MNLLCPKCHSKSILKKGFYRQKLTRKKIQRFQCLSCFKHFSQSTLSMTYCQKKPFINKSLFLYISSGMSLRRTAKILNVSFSTIYRRFLWLSDVAKDKHSLFLSSLDSAKVLYLDEMESIEHTKLKPLTVPLIVDQDQRILGVSVGTISAKGHLAEISLKKYGKRPNQSEERILEILKNLPQNMRPHCIKSDGKLLYKKLIQQKWQNINHEVFIRKSDRRIEQPHLKSEKKRFDPMFAINQRCAKLRADVNRLIRRSWSTTKKIENLKKHLIIYSCYNNQVDLFS
jgi:transposase-like protein